MKIKASGRAALILATAFLVGFAASPPATAGTDDAGAKSVRHYRHYVHHRSGKVAAKSSDSKKDIVPDAADNNTAVTALPSWIANANAQQFAAADSAVADSARAMTTRANDIMQAAADAQPAPGSQVVAPDQLNDVDRALREETPPPQPTTLAMAAAEAPAAPAARAIASDESSTWDETSLIGKIFIGFGALLTIASAARMFMA